MRNPIPLFRLVLSRSLLIFLVSFPHSGHAASFLTKLVAKIGQSCQDLLDSKRIQIPWTTVESESPSVPMFFVFAEAQPDVTAFKWYRNHSPDPRFWRLHRNLFGTSIPSRLSWNAGQSLISLNWEHLHEFKEWFGARLAESGRKETLILDGHEVRRADSSEMKLFRKVGSPEPGNEFGVQEIGRITLTTRQGFVIQTTESVGTLTSAFTPRSVISNLSTILEEAEKRSLEPLEAKIEHIHPVAGFFYREESATPRVSGYFNDLSPGDLISVKKVSAHFPDLRIRVVAITPEGLSYSAAFLNGESTPPR